MSPEVVIQDVVGKAIRKVSLPDGVNSVAQVGDLSAKVTSPGVVRISTGLISGTQEMLSRRHVGSEGIEVGFESEGAGRIDLRRVDFRGEVSFISVVAKPNSELA